jgi:hypothetical protein
MVGNKIELDAVFEIGLAAGEEETEAAHVVYGLVGDLFG